MAASSYRRDFLLIEEPSDNTMKLEKNKSSLSFDPKLFISSSFIGISETAEETQRVSTSHAANSLVTVPTSFDPTYVPCNLRT